MGCRGINYELMTFLTLGELTSLRIELLWRYMLSSSQLKFVVDVLVTIGEVSLASLVIPYFISSGLSVSQLVVGFLAFMGSWILGLVVARKIV